MGLLGVLTNALNYFGKKEMAEVQTTQTTTLSQAKSEQSNIIEINQIHKSFRVGVQDVTVLKNINFNIRYGDFIIIFGPSGCGKSTLLHIILGLEPPTTGEIKFLGQDIYKNSDEDARSEFRKQHVGMVFQQANWIKSLQVRENVAFPLLLLGSEKPRAFIKATEMLRKLELEAWADYMPTELSGGQQQRISLARALINNPEIIIADEPTGNLDFKAGQDIMRLLKEMNTNENKTVIMVTHDLEYLTYANTAVRMLDGEVIGVYQEGDKEKLIGELQMKRIGSIKGSENFVGDGKPDEPKGEIQKEDVQKTEIQQSEAVSTQAQQQNESQQPEQQIEPPKLQEQQEVQQIEPPKLQEQQNLSAVEEPVVKENPDNKRPKIRPKREVRKFKRNG